MIETFLDFDNVIFNTLKFKRALMRVFKEGGVSMQDFKRTYEASKNGGSYSPTKHLRILACEEHDADMKRVHAGIALLIADASAFVFRDAYVFFSRQEKKNLRLLSFGDPVFQKKKITGTGVKKYFSQIIVTEGDKGKEIEKAIRVPMNMRRGRVVFIDDSDVHIREARRIPGIITIQLRRRSAIHKSSAADYHVSTLAQAAKIIASL